MNILSSASFPGCHGFFPLDEDVGGATNTAGLVADASTPTTNPPLPDSPKQPTPAPQTPTQPSPLPTTCKSGEKNACNPEIAKGTPPRNPYGPATNPGDPVLIKPKVAYSDTGEETNPAGKRKGPPPPAAVAYSDTGEETNPAGKRKGPPPPVAARYFQDSKVAMNDSLPPWIVPTLPTEGIA